MILFPHVKINIGLEVLGKRTDGLHDLESLFFPLRFSDILEVIPGEKGKSKIELHLSGLPVPGDPASNLCHQAYHCIDQESELPPIKVFLHKLIPSGAGLGGGSSDAAFLAEYLISRYLPELSEEKTLEILSSLGSDLPFFHSGQPCMISGRGEYLDPIQMDLSQYYFLLIHPGIHIDTGSIFKACQPRQRTSSLKERMDALPVEAWKENIVNDLEAVAIDKHPEIGEIKGHLYRSGALYASMSGSGSSVYGIFEQKPRKLPASLRQQIIWEGSGQLPT